MGTIHTSRIYKSNDFGIITERIIKKNGEGHILSDVSRALDKIKPFLSKTSSDNIKNFIELRIDGHVTTSPDLHVQVPKAQGLLKRMLGAIGIKFKPTYETLPRPTDDVMDAFRQHGFTDADIAKLVQKMKASGIKTDDEIIQIANEIPLPLQINESLLTRRKLIADA